MIDQVRALDSSFADQTEEWRARALEYAASATARLDEGSEIVKDYVKKQPVRALGLAVGLGVLVGWLIKRR